MSYEVESIFLGRNVPWFGLGNGVRDAQNSAEAIQMAGIGWRVEQSILKDDRNEEVEGYLLNYRDVDHKPLGVVTKKYRIVQNEEAFDFTDSLVGNGIVYESAGSLDSGKRIWLTANLEKTTVIGEEFDTYLVFTNAHDGRGAVKVAITPVRVWCQNMMNLAIKKASRSWSCEHTGDIKLKMTEAKLTLLNAEKYMSAFKTEAERLALKNMTLDEVNRYIKELMPVDDNDDTEKKNNIISLREELMNRYMFAPDLENMEHTAYRFLNAVSDFTTHREPQRRTRNYQENMFIRSVDGNRVLDEAYKMMA